VLQSRDPTFQGLSSFDQDWGTAAGGTRVARLTSQLARPRAGANDLWVTALAIESGSLPLRKVSRSDYHDGRLYRPSKNWSTSPQRAQDAHLHADDVKTSASESS